MITRVDPERPPAVGEFYRFTLGLGLRAMVTNVELFRTVEYAWLLAGLGPVWGRNVLDYACWTSYLPAYFAAKGAHVVAIDFPEAIRRQERRRLRRGSWRGTWVNVGGGTSTAAALPLASRSVDLAYAVSSLDHLPGDLDAAAFAEMLRVATDGGTVFFTVPYGERYDESTFGGWLQKRYDWDAVQAKFLAQAAGMRSDLFFFGDARTRSWTARYWKLPRLARVATRRLQFVAAQRLAARDAAHARDASLIGVRVRKPAEVAS